MVGINKDATEIVVTCKCGCDESMHIRVIGKGETTAYISFSTSKFYSAQLNIFDNVKKYFTHLIHPKNSIFELCLGEDDYKYFIDCLEKLVDTMSYIEDTNKIKNKSKLYIEKEVGDIYFLGLTTNKKSPFKFYRVFDLEATKVQLENYIKYANSKIKCEVAGNEDNVGK